MSRCIRERWPRTGAITADETGGQGRSTPEWCRPWGRSGQRACGVVEMRGGDRTGPRRLEEIGTGSAVQGTCAGHNGAVHFCSSESRCPPTIFMDNGDYPSNVEEARRGEWWSRHPGGRDDLAPPACASSARSAARNMHATTTRCCRNAASANRESVQCARRCSMAPMHEQLNARRADQWLDPVRAPAGRSQSGGEPDSSQRRWGPSHRSGANQGSPNASDALPHLSGGGPVPL